MLADPHPWKNLLDDAAELDEMAVADFNLLLFDFILIR